MKRTLKLASKSGLGLMQMSLVCRGLAGIIIAL